MKLEITKELNGLGITSRELFDAVTAAEDKCHKDEFDTSKISVSELKNIASLLGVSAWTLLRRGDENRQIMQRLKNAACIKDDEEIINKICENADVDYVTKVLVKTGQIENVSVDDFYNVLKALGVTAIDFWNTEEDATKSWLTRVSLLHAYEMRKINQSLQNLIMVLSKL